MSEMIERVALAILKEQQKEAFPNNLNLARAAIEAMREPADLVGNRLPDGYRPGSHSATQIWQSMIDAALSEP